jgi:hypothetical protein
MFVTRSAFTFLSAVRPADAVAGAELLFCLDTDHGRMYRVRPGGSYFMPMQPEPRTAVQLTAAPLSCDVECVGGHGFYLDTDPTQRFRVSADGATYVQVDGAPESTAEGADRTLSVLDTNRTLVAAAARTFTVAKGMAPNFRPTFIGAGVVTIAAASGVTVADRRTTGAANPLATLTRLAVNSWAVTGTKA